MKVARMFEKSDRDYIRTTGDFLLDPRRLNVALSRAKENWYWSHRPWEPSR